MSNKKFTKRIRTFTTIPLAATRDRVEPAASVCGGCTACCTVMRVEEIKKEPYTACKHECAAGCAIYTTRPASCRGFTCLWHDGVIIIDGDRHHPVFRPDMFGVMFYWSQEETFGLPAGSVLIAAETTEGAIESPPAHNLLVKMAKENVVVLIRKDGGRSVVGPERMMEYIAGEVERVKQQYGK